MSENELRFVDKGGGDYDVVAGPVVIEVSYDGTKYAVGDWMFWNVRIGEHRFGGTQHIGPGPFADWLEQQVTPLGRRTPPDRGP